VASEEAKDLASICVDVSFSPEPPELPAPAAGSAALPASAPSPEAVVDRALLGRLQHSGPVTTQKLSDLFGIASDANPSAPCATIDKKVNSAFETIASHANPCPISPAWLDASLWRFNRARCMDRRHRMHAGRVGPQFSLPRKTSCRAGNTQRRLHLT
jgi:hypothetical protein